MTKRQAGPQGLATPEVAAATSGDVARRRVGFVMTAAELQALRRAEARFLFLRDLLPAANSQRITALGNAARAMLEALQDIGAESNTMTPELSDLLREMQEREGWRSGKFQYLERMHAAAEILHSVERACREFVRAGVPGSESMGRWIVCAVDAWRDAGLKPSASERGRFVKALRCFKGHPSIPAVSPRKLGRALSAWRQECRTGG